MERKTFVKGSNSKRKSILNTKSKTFILENFKIRHFINLEKETLDKVTKIKILFAMVGV